MGLKKNVAIIYREADYEDVTDVIMMMIFKFLMQYHIISKTKHLYNICTMLDQRQDISMWSRLVV